MIHVFETCCAGRVGSTIWGKVAFGRSGFPIEPGCKASNAGGHSTATGGANLALKRIVDFVSCSLVN